MRKRIWLYFVLLLAFKSYAQEDFKFPMGVKDGSDDVYAAMPQKTSLTRQFYSNLSNNFSLKEYSPTPKSQGRFGTCTAWAVAYAARTIIEAQRNEWTDKDYITENAFTPAFTFRMVESPSENPTCWGAYTGSAIKSLVDVGALPLNKWDFSGDTFHCPSFSMDYDLVQEAGNYKLQEFTKLFNSFYSGDKTSLVKLSLSNGNPVVISMICPTSFHYVQGELWEPTENPEFGDHGRHAMTTVAYDDDKYGGAFLIQNSWGENYGDGGYVWVKYKDFNDFVYQAIELVQMPKLKIEEPIFKGKLRIYSLDKDENLEVSLTEKYRQWNTNLGGGDESNYKVKEALSSGSRVRLYIENEQPAFVYLLSTTSVDKSVHELFPLEGSGLSAALNYKDNEVALPNEVGNFEMDDQVGTDYMILLFSREKIDIAHLKEDLQRRTSNSGETLRTYFGDRFIDSENVTFSQNEIAFESLYTGDDNKVMALIIEFEHVK